jgi:hypothetical protein
MIFDQIGILMSPVTKEFLRRKDLTIQKESEYKRRFDVKARKAQKKMTK